MTAAAIEPTEGFLRWRYLAWSLAALAAMIGAIVMGNLWLLDFVHVASSLLWTGIDLFMGFVLGPTLRRVPLPVRREIMLEQFPEQYRDYQARTKMLVPFLL
jgi:protein-S-isoprenylcysteine O-methyltransferase Ste14